MNVEIIFSGIMVFVTTAGLLSSRSYFFSLFFALATTALAAPFWFATGKPFVVLVSVVSVVVTMVSLMVFDAVKIVQNDKNTYIKMTKGYSVASLGLSAYFCLDFVTISNFSVSSHSVFILGFAALLLFSSLLMHFVQKSIPEYELVQGHAEVKTWTFK